MRLLVTICLGAALGTSAQQCNGKADPAACAANTPAQCAGTEPSCIGDCLFNLRLSCPVLCNTCPPPVSQDCNGVVDPAECASRNAGQCAGTDASCLGDCLFNLRLNCPVLCDTCPEPPQGSGAQGSGFDSTAPPTAVPTAAPTLISPTPAPAIVTTTTTTTDSTTTSTTPTTVEMTPTASALCNGKADHARCNDAALLLCEHPFLGGSTRNKCPILCNACVVTTSTTTVTTVTTATTTTTVCNGKPDPSTCVGLDVYCNDPLYARVTRAKCPLLCDSCIDSTSTTTTDTTVTATSSTVTQTSSTATETSSTATSTT